MKKVAATLLVMGFVNASAFGGLVTFEPEKAEVFEGEQATFDVFVQTEGIGSFNFANIIAGSTDLQVLDLVYAQSWVDAQAFPPSAPVPAVIFDSDLFFGGFLSAPATGPTLVGTLTVGTDGLVAGESGEVFVDSSRDFGTSGIGLNQESEALTGSATVNVVPEPASLSLLALGAVAFLRRRRTA